VYPRTTTSPLGSTRTARLHRFRETRLGPIPAAAAVAAAAVAVASTTAEACNAAKQANNNVTMSA
jgi:hypothetical protein